jgi:type I restriction-modification system DNA methylase subunit
MLGKLSSSGTDGQFRTPRHIIRLMVEMTGPKRLKTADLIGASVPVRHVQRV